MNEMDLGNDLKPEPSGGVLSVVVRTLLALLILGAGGGLAWYFMANRPRAERQPREKLARYAEVMPLVTGDHQVTVLAMGTVMPARDVRLASEVAGRIVGVSESLVPGGFFQAGARLAEVAREDYELAVVRRRAELVQAEAERRRELGQQEVARREYEMLGQEEVSETDRLLMLREPQLQAATARVSGAKATVDAAELDLARTVLRAPFNAMVQTRNIEVGAQVGVGSEVAHLVGTDEYWVEVQLPVSEMQWLAIPGFNTEGEGAVVRIYHEPAWGREAYREGRIYRLLPSLQPEGRLARLLVSVDDPWDMALPAAARHPLLLGSFVRVEMDGKNVNDVIAVPRRALRDGNRIWVMTAEGKLAIRDVETVWSDARHVYVHDGTAVGEQLVLSDIAAPVAGMALRGNSSRKTGEQGSRVDGSTELKTDEQRADDAGAEVESGKDRP